MLCQYHGGEGERHELHVFCDASETAYGACTYLCMSTSGVQPSWPLVMGKSHLALIRSMTIPCVEQNTAMITGRLHNFVEAGLEIPLTKVVIWSDSTIVLGYIR